MRVRSIVFKLNQVAIMAPVQVPVLCACLASVGTAGCASAPDGAAPPESPAQPPAVRPVAPPAPASRLAKGVPALIDPGHRRRNKRARRGKGGVSSSESSCVFTISVTRLREPAGDLGCRSLGSDGQESDTKAKKRPESIQETAHANQRAGSLVRNGRACRAAGRR